MIEFISIFSRDNAYISSFCRGKSVFCVNDRKSVSPPLGLTIKRFDPSIDPTHISSGKPLF